jgi:spore coat protein CotH
VPLISIEVSEKIKDDPKVAAKFKITRNDSLLIEVPIGIELRGALSLSADKKSYGFEIREANDSLSNKSLLGMPKNDDWILHGVASDRSLVRNILTYSLANQMGRYAARSQFVELEINGKYQGVYVLMEKIKQDKNRVAIEKMTKKDTVGEALTGGYILMLDKTSGKGTDWEDYNAENSFKSAHDMKGQLSKKSKINYLYTYPKAEKILPVQKEYISKYIADFEKVMASEKYNNPTEGYAKYIDVDSFVDYFILNEFAQNHDAYRISTFMQKDRNQKLAMGAVWDFDIAYGPDYSFCGYLDKDAWVYVYNQHCGDDAWVIPFWWEKLLQDSAFKSKVSKRWKALRINVLSDENVIKNIDQLTQYLHENNLVDRNYERWANKKPETFKERHLKHINHIKNWTKQHSEWLDGQIEKF